LCLSDILFPVLVNCAAYREGQRIADIPVTEIRANLSHPGGFVWVAIKDPEPQELDQLQEEFDLHPLAVEDARHGHQRPKLEEYGSSLFVVMHMIEADGDELRLGEVAVFVGPQYIISVRNTAQVGFTDVRRRCEDEPDLLRHGPAYVLYALMDAVVDRYFPIIDRLTGEVEDIEERIFANQTTRGTIEALYSFKRRLMLLDHAIAPLIEVTSKLHGGRIPPICAGLNDYFRDVYDHLIRLDRATDNLRDMVSTAISVNLSLITLQESAVTKGLAAWAALVAVPTLIAGIYGMNFTHLPGLTSWLGAPIAIGAMIVIDGYLLYKFKKSGWL
jgi:magnesium transporter